MEHSESMRTGRTGEPTARAQKDEVLCPGLGEDTERTDADRSRRYGRLRIGVSVPTPHVTAAELV